ncbi:MAG: gamma carbonic anhydrase family protein [Candidatus Helarchaeota archaeon]
MIGSYGKYHPKIASTAFIAPNAVIIGNVTIGEECVIWFNVIIRGAENEILIGNKTIIEDNCVIHGVTPIRIGNSVIIGHNTVIHSCIIEDEVLIGSNVYIYDGVEIGRGAMIGIGSVIQPHEKLEPEKYYQGTPKVRKVKKVKVDLTRNRKYIEQNIAFAKKFLYNFEKLEEGK